MCKRLVIPEQEDAEKEVSVDQRWWRFSVRFNVAVTHRVPVARLHEWDTADSPLHTVRFQIRWLDAAQARFHQPIMTARRGDQF